METLPSGETSLSKMPRDGSSRTRLFRSSYFFLVNVSPDEKWAALWNFEDGAVLLPLSGGPMHRLCMCGMGPLLPDSPKVSWSGDGKALLVGLDAPPSGGATDFVVTPWDGIEGFTDGAAPSRTGWQQRPETREIREASIALGPTADTYAFTRSSQQSNLYRIRLRQ